MNNPRESDAERMKKILLGVGLVGLGLVTAAAVGLVVVRKRETLLYEPDLDAVLGIGA